MPLKATGLATRGVRGQQGSVLALVPAGFMVLVVLAAFAINSAVAYKASQQLHDTLLAAANDGAAAGLDGASFYSTGNLVLAPQLVAQQVCASVAAQNTPGLRAVVVGLSIDGLWVRVTGKAFAEGLFARGLPGFGAIRVSSSATAVVASGPSEASPPSFTPPVVLSC